MRQKEQILNLWADGHSAEDIAELVFVERVTVFRTLARARAIGDERAARRIGRIHAMRRRRKIKELTNDGFEPNAIAKALGVTKRLVLIRLREMQI